ncbi:hypothetical protein FDP41_007691 [Naegleria fowleri]|uniref:Serpin domain-containing protein n=1 Tax=Naegleria fowleri TaxID=5763 RepID=A0A6A5C7N3_NAEFO|nr:uncharacterized protein FDP41_007691 [Naegleria fowleri]KAF0983776.1 hypothetical protein FDP41_007691 [Naegleria fowleri]
MLPNEEHDEKKVTLEGERKFDQFLAQQVATPKSFSTKTGIKLKTLYIPKFNIEFEASLSEILQEPPFFMKSAFLKADFSNLSREPLQISDVIHKAVIKVDESGTEAAAATAVIMSRCIKVSNEPKKEHQFIANRPFGLIIMHEPTETVLFMGKVNHL